ncbi:hypothetical protein SNE40_005966 [Patella caerulea]|uniref:Reverse transcriptase domain-containing protein n=1 Tax=Patella caerulea TaxID=87958 RepID=A0AAN8K047_PATCE
MDSLDSVCNLLKPNVFMASIDLKNAYHGINIAKTSTKMLKFRWNNTLFQYTCLPFGLTSAPRIFTKVLKPVVAYFRENGILCVAYIDDIYVQAETLCDLEYALSKIIVTLQNLGFTINWEKSNLVPSKEIIFLGFILNSDKMTIKLPDQKAIDIIKFSKSVIKSSAPSIRDVAKLLGFFNSSMPAVMYGQSHYRDLDRNKMEYLRKCNWDFDSKMELSSLAKEDINWWQKNILGSEKPLIKEKPFLTIQTDSSSIRWGATDTNRAIGGDWSLDEKTLHINVLETKAICMALRSFEKCHYFKNRHIRIQCDNTTAVSYIKNMGGTKSSMCNQIAKEIWNWAEHNQNWISISHIAGALNVGADKASRETLSNRTEWSLRPDIFKDITEVLDTEPTIDLFASRLNFKIKRYASWKLEPGATYIDAFSEDWGNEIVYCFPPFCLLSRCIQKIITDGSRGIVIAPLWPTQSWFSNLLSILCFRPIMLP